MDRRTLCRKAAAAFAVLTGGEKLQFGVKNQEPALFHRSKFRPSSGEDPVNLSIQVPTSLNDPLWEKLGYGPEDILAMATRSHILNVQMGLRRAFNQDPIFDDLEYHEDVEKELQRRADKWHYVTGRPRPSTVSRSDLENLKFTDDQIARLSNLGIRVKQ